MGCAIPSRYIIILRDRGGTIICRMLDETKGGKGVESGRIFSPSVSSRFVSPLELINVFAFRVFGSYTFNRKEGDYTSFDGGKLEN